jgi:ribonuclease HII
MATAKKPKAKPKKKVVKSKRLTQLQRIELLEDIYDKALMWVHDKTECYEGKGTAAACTILERSRLEVAALNGTQAPTEMRVVFELEAK